MNLASLPALNATLNGTSAVLLILGFYFIKFRKNQVAHRNCMVSAFFVSVLFLISYLTYHFFHGATQFPGQGIIRPIYFTILISHTILAVVIVPLILITLWQAIKKNFEKHKKIE